MTSLRISADERRERGGVVCRRLAGDGLDLGDLFRGENGSGVPSAVGPQGLRVPRPESVFARRRPGRRTCPRGTRSRSWSDGGEEDDLRPDHRPIRELERGRPMLQYGARLSIELDRGARSRHAITFVNPCRSPSISATELLTRSTKAKWARAGQSTSAAAACDSVRAPISARATARPEAPLTPGPGQVAAPIIHAPGTTVR